MKLNWNNKKNLIFLELLLQIILLIENCTCDNILFFVGALSSHSHQFGLEPLANKLADRGHNVTFFTPHPPIVKNSKVNYFCPSEVSEYSKTNSDDYGIVGLKSRVEEKFSIRLFQGSNFYDGCYIQNEITLRNSEFKSWSEKNSFDLIIIDSTCNEAAFGLVHKYGTKTKTIFYTPIATVYLWDYDLFGVPPESSWFPTWDNNYEGDMGLLARIFNVYSVLSWHLTYKRNYLPRIEKLIRDEVEVKTEKGKSSSTVSELDLSLVDLIRKTSLILTSQHFSDHFAKSLPPFVVPVGGMHLEESKGKLDSELENFINESKDGFIYVSFGSTVSISSLPKELIQVFFQAFESFHNLRFLWKWEGTVPENSPKNILFKRWFAQKEVLAHKKIRGFISQGGQVSLQQAIFSGVPLIVFPVNGDQDLNAKRIRYVGNGLELEFFGLTVMDLTNKINDLLTNESYAAKAKLLSKLTRDRPMSALDTAVWWTEYILRNDDNSILKPVAFHQQWWKSRLIDVWAILFSTILALLIIIIYFIRLCINTLLHLGFHRASQPQTQPKNKQKKK